MDNASEPLAPEKVGGDDERFGHQAAPDDAPPATTRHFGLGKPTRHRACRSASGNLLGYVCRFELGAHPKSYRVISALFLSRCEELDAPRMQGTLSAKRRRRCRGQATRRIAPQPAQASSSVRQSAPVPGQFGERAWLEMTRSKQNAAGKHQSCQMRPLWLQHSDRLRFGRAPSMMAWPIHHAPSLEPHHDGGEWRS